MITNRPCQSLLAPTIDKYTMQNLNVIATELFNKIRGRFPTVTLGDEQSNVTSEPADARYFDFDFVSEGRPIGKISVSLEDLHLAVVYGKDLMTNENDTTKGNWYDFLKELRMFAKKRMMSFDTRDITKSNLNTRDYKFLANNRSGDPTMSESKLYGTSTRSYQNIGTSRLVLRHSQPVNQEQAAGRSQHVDSIYIESTEGERFKYPFKHINGARAMARHVSEGGKPFDDFGKHITSLSEELYKLRKFKSYMNRSSVMAESLSGYMDVVNERILSVKKTVEGLQKPAYYAETMQSFEAIVLEEVPTDVAENWIDQLTIKQFNEELKDVFPYIYKLVSEATHAEEITPEDMVDEAAGAQKCWPGHRKVGTQAGTGKNAGKRVNKCVKVEDESVDESGLQYYTGKKKYGKEGMAALAAAGRDGADEEELGRIKDKYKKEELELENMFDQSMGQFAESDRQPRKSVTKLTPYTPDEIKRYNRWAEQNGHGDYDPKHLFTGSVGDKMMFVGNDAPIPVEVTGLDQSAPTGVTVQTLDGSNKELDMDWINYKNQVKLRPMQGDEIEQYASEADHGAKKSDIPAYKRKAQGGDDWKLSTKDLDKEKERNISSAEYLRKQKESPDDGTMDVKINSKGQLSKADAPDQEEQKTPLSEFILSYFDRQSGQFPKGETAILTMIEKDYGEQFIEPAKQFIEQIYQVVEQHREPEETQGMQRMRELAGLR